MTRGMVCRRNSLWSLLLALAVPLLAAGLVHAQAAEPRAPMSVDQLIAALTLDEKLALLEGQAEPDSAHKQYQAGYLPGVPRLGIPALRFADGPPGVATRTPSTGMTCTMGLAATFSAEDAQRNGDVIGRDARALGQDVVLEPYINLHRDAAWGRSYNTLGEDPLLTGTLGAALIRGIQSQGVMAQAKHFLGFEGSLNVEIDEQTLHEVYLAPFVHAVEAGVASIMCAYNVINGHQACGSAPLLTQVLRNELGFTGFVTSDWGANHANTYLNAGLDLEMPGADDAAGLPVPAYFARPKLHNGLSTHSIAEARIDEAVRRILVQYQRFGRLSPGYQRTLGAQDRRGNAAVVLQTARHAATLLKNDGGLLPLRGAALGSLALVGPTARQTLATDGGGEKAGGIVSRQLGTEQALAQLLRGQAGAHVSFALADDLGGVAIPASVLSHDGKPGLARVDDKTGKRGVDAQLEFVRGRNSALPAASSVHWSGTLTVPERGAYWLNIQALGATAKLTVDGKKLNTVGAGMTDLPRYGVVHPTDGNAPVPTPDGLANSRKWLELEPGAHELLVVARADVSRAPVQLRLAWVTPAQQRAQRVAAVETARRAHTAVVFARSSSDNASQHLPEQQDELISQVARANKNTVVVLNTSQPVAMPWLSDVQAVLQMWYPGDEGGAATADVLLGRTNPGGHLPFTWPRTIEQTVAHQAEHPERSSAGLGGSGSCAAFGDTTGHGCGLTRYGEGVHVGYRFFDQTRQTPLYPFGFGLSYTTFAYSDLRVTQASDGALDVSFELRNTGSRSGDATPQLYLGAPHEPPPSVQFAERALAAFTRVSLAPRASLRVSLRVASRQLQYWSRTQGWLRATGPRTLYLGEHARHVAQQTDVNVLP